jgi:hypothetical protein
LHTEKVLGVGIGTENFDITALAGFITKVDRLRITGFCRSTPGTAKLARYCDTSTPGGRLLARACCRKKVSIFYVRNSKHFRPGLRTRIDFNSVVDP